MLINMNVYRQIILNLGPYVFIIIKDGQGNKLNKDQSSIKVIIVTKFTKQESVEKMDYIQITKDTLVNNNNNRYLSLR